MSAQPPLLAKAWASRWKTQAARFAGIAGVLLGLVAMPARAMSVIPPTFSELVAGATQIARVEIVDVASRTDNPAGGGLIHTYVKCRLLNSLKGEAPEFLTLRFLGGRVGNDQLEVADMPVFAVGEKYVFFVAENGTAFCPLLRVMYGSYPVVKDNTAAGTERVLRNNGEPLQDVGAVVHAMADQGGPDRARVASVSALSVADFEAAILRELANAKKP